VTAGLLLVDLQNDFLHPDGAYHRGGAANPNAEGLVTRVAELAATAREARVPVVATRFTLVPGPDGEPIVADHLRRLRPFLRRGDFAEGAWGHAVVDELLPVDGSVDKVVYSAFRHTRLEWLLRSFGVDRLVVAGIVTNGGVASTVRDAHSRGFEVDVVGDCCAAFDRAVHEATLTSFTGVANVMNAREAIEVVRRGRSADRKGGAT